MKHCVVTGGAGFIGSHIVESLVNLGHSVRVVDDFSSGQLLNLHKVLGSDRVEVIEGSIVDADLCKDIMKGQDYVFHHAAKVSVPESIENPQLYYEVNIQGTMNMLEACRLENGFRRFINVGSSAAYGRCEIFPIKETQPVNTLSPYALTKYIQEMLCFTYSESYGLETINLRYFNVYGERQNIDSPYAAVIPIFVVKHIRNQPLVVFGDGKQTRDFVHVSDVVRANLCAMNAKEAQGQVYNIAGGSTISVLDLVHLVGKVSGKEGVVEYRESRKGEVLHSHASIEKAKRELHWEPQCFLEEGVKNLWFWYQSRLDSVLQS
ncbi:MAG: GDP-mannose 4,6-dehydratase [Bdellovibrionales bacterium]|nr:GDP-mannose 4,6-dehydratase [Bdellovibrionales bacterium]